MEKELAGANMHLAGTEKGVEWQSKGRGGK